MLIYSEPGISSDNLNKLGQQLAHLFKQVGLISFRMLFVININVDFSQDVQLWDVKAKQLKSWVDRGLLNVKLLDRTLAYFQNQSSYLQYIRTLKRPVPRIESPGFPGTQWSEFYWKDQTVTFCFII